MSVPAQSVFFNSAPSGNTSLAIPISFAAVADFGTRYGNTFDEVRVLGASVKITPLQLVSGVTKFFWSERALTTDVDRVTVLYRKVRDIANSNAAVTSGTTYTMVYRSTGFQDLSFDPIDSTVPCAYFNAFTSDVYGTTGDQQLFMLDVTLDVQFRGLGFP